MIPSPENSVKHAELLNNSYRHWTGEPLVEGNLGGQALAGALAHAPFAQLSHGTQNDPLFNYGNHQALKLFELEWAELIGMPSRLSAEPMNREERAAMLEEVKTLGYSNSYQGVRISGKGNRFLITKAVIWNLIDEQGTLLGQAAKLDEWTAI